MTSDEVLPNRVDILVQSQARFLQFLERRMRSRADAEDVLQAAFLKLITRKETLRDEEKLVDRGSISCCAT